MRSHAAQPAVVRHSSSPFGGTTRVSGANACSGLDLTRRWDHLRRLTPMERYGVMTRLPPDLMLAAMDSTIGLIWIISSPSRSSSAALQIARELLPIRVWGIYFLLVGLLLFASVLVARFDWHRGLVWIRMSWWLGPALFFMWAIMFAISGVVDAHAAFTGVPIYLYLSYRHTLILIRH